MKTDVAANFFLLEQFLVINHSLKTIFLNVFARNYRELEFKHKQNTHFLYGKTIVNFIELRVRICDIHFLEFS